MFIFSFWLSIKCKALVKDLRQNQGNEERAVALTGRITSVANKMKQLEFDRTENNATLIQIHSCSVTLWNIAVAMKTGGQTEAVNNARCKLLSWLFLHVFISNDVCYFR